MRPLADISADFLRFSEECMSASPLYSRLARSIANDDELLRLANRASAPPVTNLFFGAVHLLLLGGTRHELAGFYPSLPEESRSGNPFGAFLDFCRENRAEIEGVLRTRRVQTNEPRRSALILPALATVEARTGGPLALVEVGASAGLNLLFDRYSYEYTPCGRIGDSEVVLECEVRGAELPLPDRMPEVAFRVGLDLAPVDIYDEKDVAWLMALIWPEEFRERSRLLAGAIEVCRGDPPDLIAGDALDTLPGVLKRLPQNASPVVFHTFTINQFSEEAHLRFKSLLNKHASRSGSLHEVSISWYPGDDFASIELTRYPRGNPELLARCDGHAAWIEWLR